MKILLTGVTGYVGKRLLRILINQGHDVICCVRDKYRFYYPEELQHKIEVLEVDFLDRETVRQIPADINAAYYLIHSMADPDSNYDELETLAATNFVNQINNTACQQIIYLSGIVNDNELSKHLRSRKNVENILATATHPLTSLRAGIIVGSGSASFEIMRDLVTKIPLIIAPKMINTKCQPIGINDVLAFLSRSLFNSRTYGQRFDIGGPDILSYKEMLLEFAKVQKINRRIITIPFMTPKFSSYWLYFVTSTSFNLASALVSSMKVEVICRDRRLNEILGLQPMSFHNALVLALSRIKEDNVPSSWKDAYISGPFTSRIASHLKVPKKDCYTDRRKMIIQDRAYTLNQIWSIGGESGWYYGNWLWSMRGFIDRLFGGVGTRRGRTRRHEIHAGDVIDFWRVIYANKTEGRLILYAEMKLPGEAWLEFKIIHDTLYQSATFKPDGFLGKLYWYSVLPFHGFIFNGMINKLIKP